MSSVLSDQAHLSVRLPAATRDRLEALAKKRGETAQALVGQLVEGFLTNADNKPPTPADMADVLRSHAATLREHGVIALWVFGSVARGDARADSDVDLLVDIDPGAGLSLVGFASVRSLVSEWLARPADLVERSALRPAVREAAERDAVRVL